MSRNTDLVREYLDGASVFALAEKYRVSVRTIRTVTGTDSARAAPMEVRPLLLDAGKPIQG